MAAVSKAGQIPAERRVVITEQLRAMDLKALFVLRDSTAILSGFMVGQLAAPGLNELAAMIQDELKRRTA